MAIEIAPKLNNNLKNFPYAIQRHFVMYHDHSDFICKYLAKNLKNQSKLVSNEVKKTTESKVYLFWSCAFLFYASVVHVIS